MRIDELVPPKPLKPGATGRVGNITYKYDATAGWLDQAGRPAQGLAKQQLMKQYGLDISGQPTGPSIADRISSKLGGPFGQGTDPKANKFTKAMGKLGSALGRGAAAMIRPKAQPTAQDTDGDGQPDATPQGEYIPGVDSRLGGVRQQMKNLGLTGTKPVPTGFDTKIQQAFRSAKFNKDHFEKLGNMIIDLDRRGFIVKPYVNAWFNLRQADMQSLDLRRLKILAGI